MQTSIVEQIKDKLMKDQEELAKEKQDLKDQGLFSQSDVILGRETEIKELLEYIKTFEEDTQENDNHKSTEEHSAMEALAVNLFILLFGIACLGLWVLNDMDVVLDSYFGTVHMFSKG